MILSQQYQIHDTMQAMNDFESAAMPGTDAATTVPGAMGHDGDCVHVAPGPVPQGLEGRVPLLLVRLGTQLSEMADDRLAEAGVGGRGYGILAILATDGPGSQFELAKMLGKAPGVIVTAIDQLEEAGLVERNRDPADRRRSVVTLTPAGHEALARADELANTTLVELLGGLGADELTELKRLVAKGLRGDFSGS
jgi:MarR family transcriptional regulator, lower aerobic nicotinate degradation pathway regulator